MKDQDYYKVGTADDIVVSNSSLSHINSLQGGSPLKFLEFFNDNKEEKENRSLIQGSAIHLWAENPDAFIVAEIDKPAETLGQIADILVKSITEGLVSEPYDLDLLTLQVCRTVGWNAKWGDEAVMKNACPKIVPYVIEALDIANSGKQFLTKAVKETVEKCTASIKANDAANKLLFWKDDFSDKLYYKEQVVFFEWMGLKCKAKFDDVEIDLEDKTITITDIKTTSKSAYLFPETIKFWRYHRQLAFYKRAVSEFLSQNDILDAYQYKFIYKNVVVETFGLYQCVVWEIEEKVIEEGYHEIVSLLNRIQYHIDNNLWNMSYEEHLYGNMVLNLEKWQTL